MQVPQSRLTLILLTVFICMILLSACRTNVDVNVYFMPGAPLSSIEIEALQEKFEAYGDESTTTNMFVASGATFVKAVIDMTTDRFGIIVVPTNTFYNFGEDNKDLIDLSGVFSIDQFPDGVLMSQIDGEPRLYGVPMHESAWLRSVDYQGRDLYAFIPKNVPDLQQAVVFLERLMFEERN